MVAPKKEMRTVGRIQTERATIPTLIRIVKIPMLTMISGRAKVVTSGFTIELTREKTRPATTKSQTFAC